MGLGLRCTRGRGWVGKLYRSRGEGVLLPAAVEFGSLFACGCWCLFVLCYWSICVRPVRGGTHFLCRRKESMQRKRAQTANSSADPLASRGSWLRRDWACAPPHLSDQAVILPAALRAPTRYFLVWLFFALLVGLCVSLLVVCIFGLLGHAGSAVLSRGGRPGAAWGVAYNRACQVAVFPVSPRLRRR